MLTKLKLLSFIYIIVIIGISSKVYASAWVPDVGEYFFGIYADKQTSLSKVAKSNFDAYNKIQNDINARIALRYDISNRKIQENLPEATRQKRIEILDSEIENLKNTQNQIRLFYPIYTSNFHIERGVFVGASFGVSISQSRYKSFLGCETRFSSGEVFFRKKIYQSKKHYISLKLGAEADSNSDYLNPLIGIDLSRVTARKKIFKFINSVNLSYISSKDFKVSSSVSNTIEHIDSGFSISAEYTAIYNKSNKEPYRYYYKDQLRFAKKLGPDIISPFKGITISFGLYNEYYSKYYTQLGRGITFGLWGQI